MGRERDHEKFRWVHRRKKNVDKSRASHRLVLFIRAGGQTKALVHGIPGIINNLSLCKATLVKLGRRYDEYGGGGAQRTKLRESGEPQRSNVCKGEEGRGCGIFFWTYIPGMLYAAGGFHPRWPTYLANESGDRPRVAFHYGKVPLPARQVLV